MAKNDWYMIKQADPTTDLFEVVKFDRFHDPVESYYVTDIGDTWGTMICTCFAAHRQTCRHRKMLRTFQAEQRINKPWLYSFDDQKWLELKGVDNG